MTCGQCGGEHYVSDDRYVNGYDKSSKIDEKGIDLNRFLWKQKIFQKN